jgi:tetratricopeptide (TPR) repeat protein
MVELPRLKSDDPTTQYHAALLQLAAGADEEGYRKIASSILDRFAGTDDPQVALEVARAGSLGPGIRDPEKLIALAEKSVARAPGEAWRIYVLGLALYRAGRYEEAIAKLNESNEAGRSWHARALNWPILAMAHDRLGHADEASRWLARADEADTRPMETWWDLLEMKAFLREARRLVRASTFPDDPFARPD